MYSPKPCAGVYGSNRAGCRAGASAADAPAPGRRLGTGSQFRQLIDRYRNEGGGRTVSGALPIDVTFPTLGPSLFMASELTAESAAPSIDLTIRRVK